MRIGEKIRQLRVERGLTQQELARHLGKSRAAVGKYETGVRLPDNDTLHAVCDYFNVTTDYLLGRSDRRSSSSVPSLEDCLEAQAVYRGHTLNQEQKRLLTALLDAMTESRS